MDFFYNIGTKRGRSLAAWEKKYPKQTKDLREGGERLINEAQKLLDNTLVYLKQMATARALRQPDQYMEVAHKIKGDFDKFDSGDKGFRAYYNTAIIPWLKIKDEMDKTQKGEAPPDPVAGLGVGDNTGKIELGHEPSPPVVPPTGSLPPPIVPPMGAGFVGVPVSPAAPSNVPPMPGGTQAPPQPQAQPEIPEAPDTLPQLPLFPKAHQKFYESLESLSKEDPQILAKYISKYASSIQEYDPEVAINLLLLVKQIRR